jgi:heme-degrading monooxygenase HmoA
VDHHLAQFNIARLHQPLDHPDTASFVAVLDEVNKLAESSPGFVWRLQTDDGDATAYRVLDDDMMIVNLTVWESVEALSDFAYRSEHKEVMRRRREWFEPHAGPYLVCWWLPAGELPTVEDAVRRLELLSASGPGPDAFTLAAPLPPPGRGS